MIPCTLLSSIGTVPISQLSTVRRGGEYLTRCLITGLLSGGPLFSAPFDSVFLPSGAMSSSSFRLPLQTLIVVVACGGAALLIVVVGIMWCCHQRRHRRKTLEALSEYTPPLLGAGHSSCLICPVESSSSLESCPDGTSLPAETECEMSTAPPDPPAPSIPASSSEHAGAVAVDATQAFAPESSRHGRAPSEGAGEPSTSLSSLERSQRAEAASASFTPPSHGGPDPGVRARPPNPVRERRRRRRRKYAVDAGVRLAGEGVRAMRGQSVESETCSSSDIVQPPPYDEHT